MECSVRQPSLPDQLTPPLPTHTHTHTHTCITRVHGDKHRAGGVQLDLGTLEQQHRGTGVDPPLDSEDLLCHHRQHLKVDAVELVKARPRPTRCQPFEELAKGNVVKTVRAVEHHALRKDQWQLQVNFQSIKYLEKVLNADLIVTLYPTHKIHCCMSVLP